MELLEVKLLHKYARIRSYMNDLISGNFVVYDFLYECLADHIESFIYDLAYIESNKVCKQVCIFFYFLILIVSAA